MGMANKAPESRYVRKYSISHHALERFRERVEEDVKCRSNHDISNLLDEKICQALPMTVRDPRAPEAITQLHAIELRSGTYYAVVRDGTAITVLDETMVKNSYSMENWKSTMNAPFTKAALAAVQAAPTRKLTPTDEAILRGDLPLSALNSKLPLAPPSSALTPIEAAGIAYANALKHEHDCAHRLERAQVAVTLAETARQEACEQLAVITKTLIDLTSGKA